MILKGLLALAIGVLLLWVGRNNWVHRDTDAIPRIEDQVLSVTAAEPLPRGKFDRVSRWVQAGFGLVFGLFFSFIGFVLIFDLGD